jgi:hypothetical protein
MAQARSSKQRSREREHRHTGDDNDDGYRMPSADPLTELQVCSKHAKQDGRLPNG